MSSDRLRGKPFHTDKGKSVLFVALPTPAGNSIPTDNIPLLEALLNAGANVNTVDEHGETLLMWAVQTSRRETVRLLLERGASVNVVGDYGVPALPYAADDSDPTFIKLLLAHGALVNARDATGKTPLHWAVKSEALVIAHYQRENPVGVDVRHDATTPPNAAVFSGNADCVKLLLAILATVVTVGVVAICLFLRKAQERTSFFGAVDPMTGYRCRITLSSGWKQEAWDSENPYNALFVAPPLSPVQEWINRHLSHRTATEPARIDLDSGPLANSPLNGGYPEVTLYRRERILTHRHLHVNGYNATLMAFDAPGRSPNYGEYLSVYVPASATVYRVAGVSVASSADRLDREMQGVIASFQVEKVPVSATDLEVIEAALSDWQSLNALEHRKSGDDQVVVYNQCLEDFKPRSRKIILSDMKAFRAEVNKAWAAPDSSIFDDANTLDGPTWRKFFPHAFGYIYAGRPTYPDNETAILELTSGLGGQHGNSTNTYTLKKKQGKWIVITRDVMHPVQQTASGLPTKTCRIWREPTKMKTTSFQKTIPFLAIIGALQFWISAALTQEKASPPVVVAAQAKGDAPQLVLHLSGKKPPADKGTFDLHIEDCIEVSIENKGKTAVTLAGPREGSDRAWRTPIIGISILNAKDAKTKHPDTMPPDTGMPICGNIPSGDLLFTLAPGQTRNLNLRRCFYMFGMKLSGPGLYRIVFYYTNDPTGKLFARPSGGGHEIPEPDVRASTPCTIRSNEIEWRWETPSPVKPAK